MKDIFLPVVGYEGLYEISSDGRVRSLRLGRIRARIPDGLMSFRKNKDGYVVVDLRAENGTKKTAYVHRLVAEAFIPRTNETRVEVNHIDGDKGNPNLKNLEWVSRSENVRHAIDSLGLIRGTRNALAKLSDDKVRYIKLSSAPNFALASELGVSPSIISHVRRGAIWRHVHA